MRESSRELLPLISQSYTPAFKQCMLGQGFRWQRTTVKGKGAPTNGVDDCIAIDMC